MILFGCIKSLILGHDYLEGFYLSTPKNPLANRYLYRLRQCRRCHRNEIITKRIIVPSERDWVKYIPSLDDKII